LSLDAKISALILPDADLENTMRECLVGTLSFNGQRYNALKILFIYELVVDRFLTRFSGAVRALAFGMPWQVGVHAHCTPHRGQQSLRP
jgi:glyceraldehyde-3-phosphate dehydrogenase (NADP+)